MNKEPLIKISHLCKEFDNITPLKDINADIYEGDIISIIGPSGTGKSTFLRCINRLETPTKGHILVENEDVTDPKVDLNQIRRKMGMVFQSFNLFSHKRVIENVMMGQVDLLKKSPQEAYDKAMELLDLVGLKEKAESFPDELSGGQKQRVAIARTLSLDPKIILFDEPTSALDPTMVDEVLYVMKQLANSGLTLLIVTHEMNFAKNVSNRIFYMDEGIIYEEGTPEEIFNNPKKLKTREFIEKLKSLTIDFEKEVFNYSNSISQIYTFCQRNGVSSDLVYKICLIEEEVCVENLMKNRNRKSTMTIVYSQKTQSVDLYIKYLGKIISFDKDLDDIQSAMIHGTTKNITSYKEDKYNVLHIEI